ncbi:hypothetical protein [Pseudomonas mosselii]|uniref:hypothetical protein n=1 Tax=Pseudomonas mosselii TaxID=78327 RepID=UPI0021D8EC1F|nr:hypothetical protein [Pseudomonas mosselii]MCU9528354.1 hypothetical protein [Pseudomonas mosselii]MCU9535527.1 hypothetical protein [Pseudomonas mosselii]MCU9543413.1 hypothetical protein [Pseudomonas mosselii]MCU9547378.1 hypothetical protein [Pseudomonas mosselii]
MLLKQNSIAGIVGGEGKGVLAALGGAIATIACVVTVPADTWTPEGLIGLGSLASLSGALMFARQESRLPTTFRQLLGTFLVVYGASSVGGGIAGHTTPAAPLLTATTERIIQDSLWKNATSIAEGQALIDAAIAANQQTLILWTAPDCTPCTAAMGLGVLNPSINPALAGYRLINIQSPHQDSKALMERFGATGLPSLILMDGNGLVPEFGHITHSIDALSVMDMLELQTQANAALR